MANKWTVVTDEKGTYAVSQNNAECIRLSPRYKRMPSGMQEHQRQALVRQYGIPRSIVERMHKAAIK